MESVRAGVLNLVKRSKDPFENLMKAIDTFPKRKTCPITNLLSILGVSQTSGVEKENKE